MALAADEAQYGYGRNINVEDAMQVLANAGYNAENWVCLTAGYQVYWYEEDNRCILYNSATAEIEYPEEYIGAKTKDGKQNIMLSPYVHVYNENHLKAQQFNMSLGSSVKVDSNGKISSTGISGSGSDVTYAISSTTTTVGGEIISSATLSSASALKALAGEDAQAIIKSALGIEGSAQEIKDTPIYMYATKESISADTTGAYASLQISSVGTEPTLENSGEVKENLYYLSIVDNNGTSEQLSAAKQAAAQYVYNIFDQITEGKIDDNVTIIIAPGTELDCSLGGADWAPCKTFEGYFGTPTGSITVNGANLSAKTGYAQTVQFTGSASGEGNSRYFVTGFFGTVYGNTTIENVVFKNLKINEPAHDYKITDKAASRNTVAVIGGIVDSGDNSKPQSYAANVVLKNIKVESSCDVKGFASAGGLIGYIGSAGDGRSPLNGKIEIQSCTVECNVTSTATDTQTNYNPVGGVIGFVCRAANTLDIDVIDCTYKGKLTGRSLIGSVCGDFLCTVDITVDGGNYDQVTYGDNVVMGRVATIAAGTQSADSVKAVKILNNPKVSTDHAPLAYAPANPDNWKYFNADLTDWTE